MDNHPVPQNISSYEFRLVGDMTLKQFIQLAAGIVMGVLFFRLPVLPIIKYPLSFISVLIGFLMAFVPINGRPFTSWLVAFFKAVYSPTEYIWIPDPEIVLPPPVITPPPPAPAPVQAPAKEVPLPMSPPLIIPSSPLPVPSVPPSPFSRMAGIATTQTTRAPGEKIPAPAPVPSPPPLPPAPPKAPSMVERITPPPPAAPAAPAKIHRPPFQYLTLTCLFCPLRLRHFHDFRSYQPQYSGRIGY